MPAECATELRVADQRAALGLLVASADSLDFDCRKYSSLERLLRVTALVLRFMDRLKMVIRPSLATSEKVATPSEVTHLAEA